MKQGKKEISRKLVKSMKQPISISLNNLYRGYGAASDL